MGKIIRLNESQLTRIIENVIKEQQDDLDLQSATQEIKQKTGEVVSSEDLEAAICGGKNIELDMSQVPQELKKPAQTAFQQLKEKVKTASLGDLIRGLRDLKKLARQQTNEQDGVYVGKGGTALAATAAGGTVATILGVPMTIGLAAAIFGSGLLLIIYAIIVSIRGGRRIPRTSCASYKGTMPRYQVNKRRKGFSNVGMTRR